MFDINSLCKHKFDGAMIVEKVIIKVSRNIMLEYTELFMIFKSKLKEEKNHGKSS